MTQKKNKEWAEFPINKVTTLNTVLTSIAREEIYLRITVSVFLLYI